LGLKLFLPFLIIDLVVASVLMSMGMMMLPPVVVSLPFKLIFRAGRRLEPGRGKLGAELWGWVGAAPKTDWQPAKASR
jgi:hypothetical protein